MIAQPISMSSLQLLALAINTISMRSAEMHCNREKRANTNTVTPILNSRFKFKKINCISMSIFKYIYIYRANKIKNELSIISYKSQK